MIISYVTFDGEFMQVETKPYTMIMIDDGKFKFIDKCGVTTTLMHYQLRTIKANA